MPNLDDISRQQAQRLLEAMRRDGFNEFTVIREGDLRGSATAAALRAIANELDTTTIEGRRLTESQKDLILEGTASYLGTRDSAPVKGAVRNASNDAFMELVGNVGKILRDKRR